MNDRIFDFPWLRSQSVVQDPRTYMCAADIRRSMQFL